MRPLTPSAIGPSLRQVERQLLEAEIQLQNHSSQIAAKFELLRASDEAAGQQDMCEDGRAGRGVSGGCGDPKTELCESTGQDDVRVMLKPAEADHEARPPTRSGR